MDDNEKRVGDQRIPARFSIVCIAAKMKKVVRDANQKIMELLHSSEKFMGKELAGVIRKCGLILS